MSGSYRFVQWNSFKRKYDLALLFIVLAYLSSFVLLASSSPFFEPMVTLIRAFGSAAFILLHVVLMIGPLSRISSKFLPLLYNRRHLGVCLFILALIHGALSTVWYHGFGDLNPVLSIFVSNSSYNEFLQFPFQALGAFALLILFVLAATSHDFWLKTLSPVFWKSLHMLVYLAYAFLVLHVSLGPLQTHQNPLLRALVLLGLSSVLLLHFAVGLFEVIKEYKARSASLNKSQDLFVAHKKDFQEGKAVIVEGKQERIAVFLYDSKISAVSNVCKHQNGPLGEGRIVNGCITCPWHGFQFSPEDGRAPAPYTDKIRTYKTKLIGEDIFVIDEAYPEGTRVEPLRLGGDA